MLVLAMAGGDAGQALACAEAILADEPTHRAAAYARVAIRAQLGDAAAAMHLAQRWSAEHGHDPAMHARAHRKPVEPTPWAARRDGGLAALTLGEDPSLDFAAAYCARDASGC